MAEANMRLLVELRGVEDCIRALHEWMQAEYPASAKIIDSNGNIINRPALMGDFEGVPEAAPVEEKLPPHPIRSKKRG